MTRSNSLPDFVEPCRAFSGTEAVGIFIRRVPGIAARADREQALEQLEHVHRHTLSHLHVDDRKLIRAEGVHGNEVKVVKDCYLREPVAGVDALITARRNVLLGIYVADCCAIYLHDPEHNVVALAHSGRKGTELNIAAETVNAMREEFGTDPGALLAQLSPCIRPPRYEVDFAARIHEQLEELGITRITDDGVCTAENWEKYYSYRREKGKTGRMLAVIWLKG